MATEYGQGRAGSVGAPKLRKLTQPLVGTAFIMRRDNVPVGASMAWLAIGASDPTSQWSPPAAGSDTGGPSGCLLLTY